MRRNIAISWLLILALAASASGCVAGWGGQSTPSTSQQPCAGEKWVSTAPAVDPCRHVLKSLPGRCGLRGFVLFQFVAIKPFQILAPLQLIASNVSTPLDSVIIVSSVGPPETDRGPPSS